MRIVRKTHWTLVTVLFLFLVGCTTSPPEPPRAPLPPPEPEPIPAPEPAPRGTAPLVGTLWKVAQQYGEEDIPAPPSGTVRFFFSPEGGSRLAVEGPRNQIFGDFTYRISESKSASLTYEEGSLLFRELAKTKMAGPYLRYEDLLMENLSLAQGYYISGDRPEESRLTIFGGFGREEIILFELTVAEE